MGTIEPAAAKKDLRLAEELLLTRERQTSPASSFVLRCPCLLMPMSPAARLYKWTGLHRWSCLLAVGVFITINLYLLHSFPIGYGTGAARRNHNNAVDAPSDDDSYGIVVDAGSTGSRLFLYAWRAASPLDDLIDVHAVDDPATGQPVVKKLSPGLSTIADNPKEAADYIRPLMDYAARYIPLEKQPHTPVFIFATAGMRLLPAATQQAIIGDLREKLPNMTRLQILAENIQVISGKWEGIYGWISINYILGRLQVSSAARRRGGATTMTRRESGGSSPSSSSRRRPQTVGVVDMGGASAQIAFELPPSKNGSIYFPATASSELGHGNENVEVIDLAPEGSGEEESGRFSYQLFVTTFLGYGVNEAWKKYEKLLLADKRGGDGIERGRIKNGSAKLDHVDDGCLPLNMLKILNNVDDGSQLVRRGTGVWDDCVRNITSLLQRNPPSHYCLPPRECFFGFVPSPSLSLSEIELYGFSEYWYSVDDVLSMGGRYNHDEFEKRARGFCEQSWSEIQRKARLNLYPKAAPDRLESQCFKSAWIHAVLHDGLMVDEVEHHFQSAYKIKGEEVQWTLGAIVYQMRNRRSYSAAHTKGDGCDSNQGWAGPFPFLFAIIALLALVGLVYYAVASKRNTSRLSSLSKKDSSYPYERLSQSERRSPVSAEDTKSYPTTVRETRAPHGGWGLRSARSQASFLV